jgi:hypothetical protein
MAVSVYSLCAAAALACTLLLLRAYLRTRTPLLLWSSACFACLTLNNVLVAVDLVFVPDVDLFPLRSLAALVGISLLLYGLIWEVR